MRLITKQYDLAHHTALAEQFMGACSFNQRNASANEAIEKGGQCLPIGWPRGRRCAPWQTSDRWLALRLGGQHRRLNSQDEQRNGQGCKQELSVPEVRLTRSWNVSS
jgi:hypothetical protein